MAPKHFCDGLPLRLKTMISLREMYFSQVRFKKWHEPAFLWGPGLFSRGSTPRPHLKRTQVGRRGATLPKFGGRAESRWAQQAWGCDHTAL